MSEDWIQNLILNFLGKLQESPNCPKSSVFLGDWWPTGGLCVLNKHYSQLCFNCFWFVVLKRCRCLTGRRTKDSMSSSQSGSCKDNKSVFQLQLNDCSHTKLNLLRWQTATSDGHRSSCSGSSVLPSDPKTKYGWSLFLRVFWWASERHRCIVETKNRQSHRETKRTLLIKG